MPMIVYGAVEDLKKKGVSISLLGDAEETEIKVFLRTVEYDEFLSGFYEKVTLSACGMCLAAAAKKTQDDLPQLSVGAVMELALPEEDSLAVLKKQQYRELPLPDPSLLIVAKARMTQHEVFASDEAVLAALGLAAEDIGAVAEAAEADQAWGAVGRWTDHHADVTLAEDQALATKTGGGGVDRRGAVCGEAPMAEGHHYAEFAVVKMGRQMHVGVVPAADAGRVTGLTEGWRNEPAVHMWAADGAHLQRGRPSGWEGQAGFKQGDVVGLLLDLDAGTLTAYKNGAVLGVMVPNAKVKELGAGPFCWALDLDSGGDAVRLARRPPPPLTPEQLSLEALVEAGLPDAETVAVLKKVHYIGFSEVKGLQPGAETGVAVAKGVFAAVDGRFGQVIRDPQQHLRVKLRWLDDGSESGYTKVDRLASVVRSRSDLLEEWLLSDEGLLIAARAGKTQGDIVSMGPSSVIELGLADEDSVAVLKKHQYSGFSEVKGLQPGAETGVAVTKGVFAAVDGRFGEVDRDPNRQHQVVKLRWLDDGSYSGYMKVDQLASVVRSRSDLIEEWLLSDEGLLLLAKAGKNQDDIRSMEPAAVIELGLADEDSLALLRKYQYGKLPLSDGGVLTAARAGKKQDDMLSMDPSAVMDLEMSDEDSLALLRKYQYDKLSLSDEGLLLAAKAGQTPQELLASDEAALAALGLAAEDIGAVAEAAEAAAGAGGEDLKSNAADFFANLQRGAIARRVI